MAYINTIELTGGETAAEIVSCRYVCIKNRGTETVYASRSPGITADSEGVMPIEPGESVVYPDCGKTLYLLGSGKVTVICSDSGENFFKPTLGGSSGGVDLVARQQVSVANENIANLSETVSRSNEKIDEINATLADSVTVSNYRNHWISNNSYAVNTTERAISVPEGACAAVISRFTGESSDDYFYAATEPNLDHSAGGEYLTLRNGQLITMEVEALSTLYISATLSASVTISFYDRYDAAIVAMEIADGI